MKSWLKLLLLIPLSSCEDEDRAGRAFYYWKTHFRYPQYERELSAKIGLERMYIRFFDVDLRNGIPLPQASIRWDDMPDSVIDVVPVVYITNRSLLNYSEENARMLADSIAAKLQRLSSHLPKHVKELQFDCDWSRGSRLAYFALLDRMKSNFPGLLISCTIRLHQVKYARESGIPPVHKGMLMFYNMGRIQDTGTVNSILDLSVAEAYLDKLDEYPLQLDLAIPIFSWGLWFRNGKPLRILNPVSRTELDTCRLFINDANRYRCIHSGIFRNEYLQVNDLIRIEELSPELSLKATKLVSSRLKKTPAWISIYHWDSSLLNKYGKENIEVLYHAVH